MQGDCGAATRCLFCAFAHVAHFHRRSPALLEPKRNPHSARRHIAEEVGGRSDKECTQTKGIAAEGEEGNHSALRSNELCVYRKQAGNPSSTTSSSLHEYPLQTHGNPHFSDKAFTYSEVLACVNALSLELQKASLSPCESASSDVLDDSALLNSVKKVGIFIPPSVEYVVAVLAVLLCGYAFVPLEPFWPAIRIAEIVADSNPCILLTSEHTSHDNIIALSDSFALPVLYVDASSPSTYDPGAHGSVLNCMCFCHTNQERPYCYLLYTSGSSGKPKGVYGTEIGLLHRLQWMQREYPFLECDVAVFKSSIAFVDHLTELFGPLLGGSLVIVPLPGDLYRNPLGLLPYMQTYNVSRLTAVPSLMRSLLPILSMYAKKHALMSVKVLILSGEILSSNLLKSIQALLLHTTILNLYGSTELSGDCLCFDCGSLENTWGNSSVPIGKPLPGCLIKIFSENSEKGDEGELWVGGVLVALGYHHDTSSTDSKFMRAPGSDAKYCQSCFFRTGDYVKKLTDGNLLFLGRKDRIVKVNGHKVALDEIESNLEKHPLVAQAAVTFQKAASSESIIVAYVVSKQQGSSNTKEVLETSEDLTNMSSVEQSEMLSCLKNWLGERLPSVNLPGRFTFLNFLPTVSAGKKDYNALDMFDMNRSGEGAIDPLETEVSPLADCIRKAFQHVLKMDDISIHDDFFSLGGTSVSAAHVAHILHIDIRLLYSHGSAIKLESILRAHQGEAMGTFASKLDETSPDSREFKRLKRIESFSTAQLVASSDYDKQSSFALGLNSHLEKDYWPCANIADPPLALLRCNACAPLNPCCLVPTTKMVHNVFLDSISTNTFCNLSILWKTELKACVDASPVLVQLTNSWRLFIGSHAHNFACLDAYSGNLLWESDLGDRVESTAALSSDFKQVVVGSYDGKVYFLESETGMINWRFQTKAEVKCQPTVGVQEGLIWCGSHDHHLYVLNTAEQKCVWDYDCKGSIFAAASHDPVRCLVYVATTAGTIIAFSMDGSHARVNWMHACEAPVFGSLALDAASGYVICTMVNGCVLALTSSGSTAWKYTTGGPVFAGATLASVLPLQVLICSRDGWVYSLHLFEGRCLWKYCLGEPITSSAYVDQGLNLVLREPCDDGVYLHSSRLVCVCGSSGQVHVLKVYTGSTACATSSCSALLNERHKRSQSLNEGRNIAANIGIRGEDIFVGGGNEDKGDMASASEDEMFKIDNGCELVARLKLPGDIFSSPVMLGGRIFVGCRDNYVYCLELSGLDFPENL